MIHLHVRQNKVLTTRLGLYNRRGQRFKGALFWAVFLSFSLSFHLLFCVLTWAYGKATLTISERNSFKYDKQLEYDKKLSNEMQKIILFNNTIMIYSSRQAIELIFLNERPWKDLKKKKKKKNC